MGNGTMGNAELRKLKGFLPYAASNNFKPVSEADMSDMIAVGVYTDAVNMADDFQRDLNQPLTYAEAYRTIATQEQRALEHTRGGPTAATPGYSNHGWGLAVDYRNGIGGGPGNSTYDWMHAHAGEYGFVEDVSGEHWHWHHPSSTSVTKPRTTEAAGDGDATIIPEFPKKDKMVYYVQLTSDSNDPRFGKITKGTNFVLDPFERTLTKVGSGLEAVIAGKAVNAEVVGIAGNQAWELVTSGGLKRKGW